MHFGRRDVLKQLLVSVWTAPAMGTGIIAFPAPAAAEPVTIAIAAAALVLNAIRSQSSRSNGISSILTAINGKLDIAISQLSNIQVALSQILQEVSQLREDFSTILNEQYTYELVNEVRATFITFTEIEKEARSSGIDLLTLSQSSRPLLDRLKNRYDQFDLSRVKLINSEYGKSSLSTTVIELCTGLDASAYAYGIISTEFFSIKLDSSAEWLREILSAAQQKSAASQLDAAKSARTTAEEALQKASRNRKNFLATMVSDIYNTPSPLAPMWFSNTFRFRIFIECTPNYCKFTHTAYTGTYLYADVMVTLSRLLEIAERKLINTRLIEIGEETDRSYVAEVTNGEAELRPQLISYGASSDRALEDMRAALKAPFDESPFTISFDDVSRMAQTTGWRFGQGEWWKEFVLQAARSRESYRAFNYTDASAIRLEVDSLNERLARIAYLEECVGYASDHLAVVSTFRQQLP